MKPRQVCYLYRCGRCAVVERRGSNAKQCSACKGPLWRLRTVAGPVKPALRIVG